MGDDFLAHGSEKSLKRLDGSLFADPEQTRDAEIDLIDQGQVFVAFGILDFIHADGINLAQGPMLESRGDNVFDSVKDLVPGSAKRLGGFFPGKAARPAGQE